MITELLKMSACEVVDALKRGEITSSDILSDLENRHLEIDPVVNALPTTCFDRAFKQAMNSEEQLTKKTSKTNQTLHGLPIPIKDSYRVEGVRTTFGSKAYEHYKPEASDVIVDIIEKAGGIVFAKSNTPEFEAGASTFNDVFGYTRNPRDLSRSVGGSSGGGSRITLGKNQMHFKTYPYVSNVGDAVTYTTRASIDTSGNFVPGSNNTYNLGTSSLRWANLYINDLQLSNEAKKDEGGNDVDGTWGDWTLQEGEDKIFMINNRTGKRYSLKMEEE